MNKLYKTTIDKEFLELLTQTFKSKDKINDAYEYFKNYNFSYIGELAERFLNTDLVSTPERLITLIDFLFNNNFREDLFQKNQKSIFVKNSLKWLTKNKTSKYHEKYIKINLINFIYIRFSKEDTYELNILNSLLLDLLMNDFDFDFKDLCVLYDNFKKYNESLGINNEKTNPILLHILTNFKMNISEYDIICLENMICSLFGDKDTNILKLLDLKVKDFKNNKENLNLLKSLRQLVYNEFDKSKIKKMQDFINLSDIEILYLNLRLNYFKVSRNANDRLYKLFFDMIILSKEDVDDSILDNVFWEKDNYYITKLYKDYHKSITNEKILKKFFNRISIDYISSNIISEILLDNNKIKLLDEKQKNYFVLSILNTIVKDKDLFDKLYKLVDFESIKKYVNDYFYCNLFEFGYLNFLDFDWLLEHNLVNNATFYVSFIKDKTFKNIYLSLIPLKIINKFNVFINISETLDELRNTFDYKKMCLLFKLTNNENLTEQDYKEIIITQSLKNVIDYSISQKSQDFPNILTNIITDNELVKYVDISKEELFRIQTTLYNSEFINDKSKELLKPLFLSKNEILKEKENVFLKNLSSYREKNLCLSTDSFVDYIIDNFNTLKESKTLQDNVISFLVDKLDQRTLRLEWSKYTRFYFFVFNSDIVTNFKENLFKIINNTYLTI